MPIYLLKSIDDNNPNWVHNDRQRDLYIRADSPTKARLRASSEYTNPSEIIPGTSTPEDPWLTDTIVSCEQVHDSGYDEDGPEEILNQ